MKQLHSKVKQLQLRANPVNYSGTYVDANGILQVVDLQIETSESDRVIKGYLSVWGVRDTYGTIFVKGCFAKSIRERGPDSASKQKIAHLWQHDCCEPTGRFTVLKEDKYGLYFEAELDDIEIGERELKQVRSGTLNQFSVGFNYIWDKVEYDEKTDSLMLLEVDLMEGSVVTLGSCDETYAFRSVDQLETDKQILIEDTEYFIKGLPRQKQLELRQLITRHNSLSKIIKPDELDQLRTLKIKKPNESTVEIGGYKLNLKEF
jgi:HK97 family phage prohead protease